jgi:hypothetical protein
MFENRALRRISGPKADKLTGGWRRLHNEELHNLYPSPSIMRMIKSMGHVEELSIRNREKEMFLGSRAQPACKADNLTAICEPIV